MPPAPTTLAEVVETRRRVRNLTQAQLAEAVGIDRTDVSRIESGLRSMTAATILRMSAVLDIPAGELTALVAAFEERRASDRVVVPPEVSQLHGPSTDELSVDDFSVPDPV